MCCTLGMGNSLPHENCPLPSSHYDPIIHYNVMTITMTVMIMHEVRVNETMPLVRFHSLDNECNKGCSFIRSARIIVVMYVFDHTA